MIWHFKIDLLSISDTIYSSCTMNTSSIAKTCWTLVNNQQITTALSKAKQETISNPHKADAHLLYAQLLLFNGETEKGYEHLKKSHNIEPQNVIIINEIAQTAQLLGKIKDALTFYALALQINPSPQQMAQCGSFMLEIGQVSEAEQLLNLSSARGNLLAIAGMINLRLRQRRNPEAADLISTHLQRLSESVSFQQATARLMLAEKEYNSALEVLGMTPPLELSNEAQIVHLRLIGESLDKLGYVDEAFTAYHDFNQLRGCTYDPPVHSKHIHNIQSQYS